MSTLSYDVTGGTDLNVGTSGGVVREDEVGAITRAVDVDASSRTGALEEELRAAQTTVVGLDSGLGLLRYVVTREGTLLETDTDTFLVTAKP